MARLSMLLASAPCRIGAASAAPARRPRRQPPSSRAMLLLSCLGLALLAARPVSSGDLPGPGLRVNHRQMLPECTTVQREDSDTCASTTAFPADGRQLQIGCRHGAVELGSTAQLLLTPPPAPCPPPRR